MRIVHEADGVSRELRPTAPLRFYAKADHQVRTEAQYGEGFCQVFSTWDYDGTMKVYLCLPWGWRGDSLRLEIPLRDDVAPMIHAMGDGIRNTVYTRVPEGEGVVWDASKCQVNDFPPNWCSYVYVGSPVRGLCWFAENDRDFSQYVTRSRIA